MRLSKQDIRLLLIVLGLLIIIFVYFIPVNNMNLEAEQYQAETAAMQPRLIELRDHYAKLGEYQSGIIEAAETFKSESALYPEQVRVEDFVMFAVMLEEDFGFEISGATFTDSVVLSNFTGIEESGDELLQTEYTAYCVEMTVSCRMDYSQFKDSVDRINATPHKTLLNTVNVSYDQETGGLVGTMTISKLFLTDGKYDYVPTDVPMGPVGLDNPFGTTVAQQDEDEAESGESSETETDETE